MPPNGSGHSKQGKENGRRGKNKSKRDRWSETDEEEPQDSASPVRREERPMISQQTRSSVSLEDLTDLEDAFGPCVQKFNEVKANLLQSAEGIDSMIEHILHSFEGKLHIVREVGETYGRENAKDEEISRLKDRVEELMRWQDKMVKPLEEKLLIQEQKYDALLSEKDALQEGYEMQYKDRETKLQKREEAFVEEKTVLEKELKTEKETAEKAFKKDFDKAVKELSLKYGSVEKNYETLQKDYASLNSKFEKSERAYDNLYSENASLRSKVEVYKTEFGAPEKPDEYL
jgi:hypothetical protein